MKSSAEKFLERIELYYENIFNLLNAFQKANSNSSSETITVTIRNLDGTVVELPVNSFQKLQQELARMDSNFRSLLNSDNVSYILNADGSLSQYTRTSFMNAQFIDSIDLNTDNIYIDNNALINDLLYPSVKLPITISKEIVTTQIYCKIFEFSYGYENITQQAPTILDIEYLYNIGKVKYREWDRELYIDKQKVQYFGKFNVETVLTNDGTSYDVILDKSKYYSVNTIGEAIDLKINDILVNKYGTAKFQITNIDRFQNTVTLLRIAGTDAIVVGLDELYFNEIIDTTENIVSLPIKPNQQLVIFLSTENPKLIGYPSNGIKIDTADYKLIYDGKTYTIDEFFSKNVVNFSEYLLNLMTEVTIPYSLGIVPDKPVLRKNNFKVVQINKHSTDTKTIQEISTLNKNKDSIKNDIEYKQHQIELKENELNTKKFNTIEEKTYLANSIYKLRNELVVLKQNLLNVAREIDTNATNYGIKDIEPKYRIIGFWEIQNNLYSPSTGKQNIIKYDVEYRYLSQNVDTTDSINYNMIVEGKEVMVSFSSWNLLETKTLSKIKNLDGNLVWEQIPLDSSDKININQLMIPINKTESVEIRIRAVSEAGYPISSVKSEWSEVIRVNFPDDLRDNNVANTISQNDIDLQNAEFIGILNNEGLLTHISDKLIEAEKTFNHQARTITSGQFTPEQKNIPLDVCIANIINRLNTIENQGNLETLAISFVDFNGENYTILNNSTTEIFAGNYTDTYDILDQINWGGIIRKRGYIRIKNGNQVPLEIKTLIPGNSNQNPSNYDPTFTDYLKVPVKIADIDNFKQTKRQILYFRPLDINASTEISQLVKPLTTEVNTSVPFNSQLDANEEDKNIVYLENNILQICKLKEQYTDDIAVYTTEHPYYNPLNPNDIENGNVLKQSFENMKTFQYIKEPIYQAEIKKIGETPPPDSLPIWNDYGLGFNENDKFAVGARTCGAFLYPIINSANAIQVVGNSSEATMVIPKESELLIPIIFEYRMIDRLGKINGLILFDINNPLEYYKKIGIDMLINNQQFKFDIGVRARLRSHVSATDVVGLGTILNNYNGQGLKENLY